MKADCRNCGEVEVVLTGEIYKCKIGRMYHAHNNKFMKENKGYSRPSFIYRKLFKGKTTCEKCEMQNEDLRFFDVNHKDGDHDNNEMENLELLCPNCHRIETLKQWGEKRMAKYNRNYLSKYIN